MFATCYWYNAIYKRNIKVAQDGNNQGQGDEQWEEYYAEYDDEPGEEAENS